MTKTFLIPPCGVNAMHGTAHLVLAPGRFTTSDRTVQNFLKNYPGVTLISSEPDPPPAKLTAEHFGPVPALSSVRTTAGLQIQERRPSKWDQ